MAAFNIFKVLQPMVKDTYSSKFKKIKAKLPTKPKEKK